MKIILTFFFILIVFSCSYFQKREKDFHPNGQLKFDVPLKNGKRHGTSHAYYHSGKLKETTEWIDGEKNGQEVEYYLSGDTMRKSDFQANVKTGKEIFFFKGGGEKEIRFYDESGHWIDFIKLDSTGELIQDIRRPVFLFSKDTFDLGEKIKLEVRVGNNHSRIRVVIGKGLSEDYREILNVIDTKISESAENDVCYFEFSPFRVGKNDLYGIAEDVVDLGDGKYEIISMPFETWFYVNE